MPRQQKPNRDTEQDSLKPEIGWLCLDFVNTVDWHDSPNPQEKLNSYADLVTWSQHANILTEQEAEKILAQTEQQPKEAKMVLERAINLREALYRAFSAVASQKTARDEDIAILNTELSKAMPHLQLKRTRNGYTLSYASDGPLLERMLWHVSRSAADLLTSEKLSRVRKCDAKDCGWLFLDMSRNRSRRWCDMKDCGNRAKARRHYQRKHVRAKKNNELLGKRNVQYAP